LLQALDDPSLLIDVAEVWRTRGQILRSAGRAVRDPQERLLTDLGRASRAAPVLAEVLRAARPTGLDLDVHQAWDFLRASAPILTRAGSGVLAPRWGGRPGARLGLRMRATPRPDPAAVAGGPSMVGLDALCDVQWEVVLGDDPLPVEELER